MDKREFYRLYLPALKRALDEDDGIYIKDPEEFIENAIDANAVIWHVEKEENDSFLDLVSYYFDARAHNFPDVGDISIEGCRDKIKLEIEELAVMYGVDFETNNDID